MKFIDTYDDIVAFFPDSGFDRSVWRVYAAKISKELADKAEKDANGYDFCKEILPVVTAAVSDKAKLGMVHRSFQSVVRGLNCRFIEKFGIDIDVTVILYLGLCNGAGWATTLDGKDTVLLGIEKIAELDWCGEESMRALIFHELGHIWHKTVGNFCIKAEEQSEKSILQLYQEGIAMFCEQILCGDESFYHQNKDGWLDWCLKNEKVLKREFLRRLKQSESTQDFFGDWCGYRGHSDVGYFLGCRFIRRLSSQYTLTGLANMNLSDLLLEFTRYAEK